MSDDQWFGANDCLGDRKIEDIIRYLRTVDDAELADELVPAQIVADHDAYALFQGKAPSRFVRVASICGFLPESGTGEMTAVASASGDADLHGKPLDISLVGLHVARYPGRGTHTLLFDFGIEPRTKSGARVFHYSSRFEAKNGETVPVHGFPLFTGLKLSGDGLVFGFRTINISSSFNETLLDFLGHDEFKNGLSLATLSNPVLGQVSQMAVSLAGWLADRKSVV